MKAPSKKAPGSQKNNDSASKDASSAEPVASTVRLDPATHDRLVAAIKADGRKSRTIWEEAIKNWLAGTGGNADDRATVVREVQSSIASAVHNRLMENDDWISDLLLARERRSFDAGIMGARSFHYNEEKETLSKCLVEPDLLGLIDGALARGEFSNACLAIDSGSGNVPFFERLNSALKSDQWKHLTGRITVLTNNIAGAGTYMRRTRDTEKGALQHGIAGPFPCSLLPGNVNSDYAAVVGENTIDALKQLEENKHKAKPEGATLYVGLLAANWVQVRPAQEGNPYAIPLVADDEQIGIKRAFCALCDYVFLTVPSPKLFLDRSIDEINKALLPVRPAYEYKAIFNVDKKEDRVLARKVRLVTTLRPETTDILYAHSRMLKALFPSAKVGDAQKREDDQPGLAEAYFFNDRTQSGKTPAEQMDIAFPHGKHTHNPAFMKKFFMIG